MRAVAPACGEQAATWLRRMYGNSFKIAFEAFPIDNDCDFAAGEDTHTHTHAHTQTRTRAHTHTQSYAQTLAHKPMTTHNQSGELLWTRPWDG